MGFDEAIQKVLIEEGGFVSDPLDHGGTTNRGITENTLAAWRKAPVTDADVKNLSVDEAKQIYKSMYWDANRVDSLPEAIRGTYFDVCVNSGGGAACNLLQRAINGAGGNVVVDGALGPNTIKAASEVNGLFNAFQTQRVAFYRRIVARDPSQVRFLDGWLNRVQSWT
jgi:lysozyme family protein